MAYSDFKLKELVKQFDLTLNENQDLFAHISEVESSEILKLALKENAALAVDINQYGSVKTVYSPEIPLNPP